MKGSLESNVQWYEKASHMNDINDLKQSNNCKNRSPDNSVKSGLEENNEEIERNMLVPLDKDPDAALHHKHIVVGIEEPPLICEDNSSQSKTQFERTECHHHDMAETERSDSQQNNYKVAVEEHCPHSDALNNNSTEKTVRVNRVSPFRYGDMDSGNLLIDLSDDIEKDIAVRKRRNTDVDEKKMKKKDIDKLSKSNGYVEDLSITQERYATDLPRHNWLVKRLTQEKQLNEGDIINVQVALNDNCNFATDKKSQSNEIEIVSVHSLNASHESSNLIGKTPNPQRTDCITEASKDIDSSSKHEIVHSRSPSNQLIDLIDTVSSRSSTDQNPVDNDIDSEKKANCDDTKDTQELVVSDVNCSTTIKQEDDLLKPDIISSSTQSKASPKKCDASLPGIDLSSIKYDTLSRFDSLSTQSVLHQPYPRVSDTHPRVSDSYLRISDSYPRMTESYPRHSDGFTFPRQAGCRNACKEVTRPIPLHLKENYKNEMNAYGLNHRVRLSLTPMSSTIDRIIFRNQSVNKPTTAHLNSYDTLQAPSLESPDVIKRNAAIQRQLESQKKWIAEHEPYKAGSLSSVSNFGDQTNARINQIKSPLNPSCLSTKFSPHQQEGMNCFSADHVSLPQHLDQLKEKINALNNEIKETQQQKDVLFASQQGIPCPDSTTHMKITVLNRKLSTLEDCRMKQSALLMKSMEQCFDQRNISAMNKSGYVESRINGVLDGDERVKTLGKSMGSPFINQMEHTDNLLLRQLQNKHDENISTVMAADGFMRTMDLSKTSELFYNKGLKVERMSQPSTPLASNGVKDYNHPGEIPPLLSAERLSPAVGFFPRKPGVPHERISPRDYPHVNPFSYSKSPDVPRAVDISHPSQNQEIARSREMMHPYSSKDIPTPGEISNHLQLQKIARSRELPHSLHLQDLARPHDLPLSQYHERTQPHPHPVNHINQLDLMNVRNHSLAHQDLSKLRETALSHLPGNGSTYLHNSCSSSNLPQNQPSTDSVYTDLRSHQYGHENALKRHAGEDHRPAHLKLARTPQNLISQIENSHPDKPFQKMMVHNQPQNLRIDNNFFPSNISSAVPSPISPYPPTSQRTTAYDLAARHLPGNLGTYDGKMSQHVTSPMKKGVRMRTCKACDKESQFLCSGCRSVWYCSRLCQLEDWKLHSKSCKKK